MSKPGRVFLGLLSVYLLFITGAAKAAVNLAIDVNPDSVQPGQQALIEIVVTNSGVTSTSDLTVTLLYPDGVNAIPESLISGPLDAAASCVGSGSTSCSAGETIQWSLGTLAPGQAVQMSLPPVVWNATAVGTLIPWEAELSDDIDSLASASSTLAVDAAPALTVAIDEDQDPVPAGGTLAYTLRYGNRSAASVTDTELEFTLPANASLVATTGGGTLSGDVLSWNLGTLPASAVGEQTLWVQVDAGAADGDLVRSEAEIGGISGALPTAREATGTAYVAPSTPLALALDVTPLPALPGQQVQVALSVTNPGASNVLGAVVRMRYPDGMQSIAESLIAGPLDAAASCAENGASTCSTRETIQWSLGTLAPGQTVQMSLPSVVWTGTAPGTLINWSALVTEDGGSLRRATETLAIGPDFPTGPADHIGVYRPGNRRFYLDVDGNNRWNAGDYLSAPFGISGDIAVTGDWNGDGIDEIGVYRPGAARFFLDLNGNDVWDGTPTDATARFGAVGDEPITGDWNGDGTDEIGVYRPGAARFYLDLNGNDVWDGTPTDATSTFGVVGDKPIIGDWNGDGTDEIGVYRPGVARFYLDLNGNDVWDGMPTDVASSFGAVGDEPIIGDWNGDGIDEIGVYQPGAARFYLDLNGNDVWDGTPTDATSRFGALVDQPIVGSW